MSLTEKMPQEQLQNTNPQLAYIDEKIATYESRAIGSFNCSVIGFTTGALLGLFAVSESLQNNGMRVGEVVTGAIATGFLVAGKMGLDCNKVYVDKATEFELTKATVLSE